MSNSIYAAPIYKLKELNNLFIELTEKNCNQRCAQCYINFPISRNTKDFISFENIKEGYAYLDTSLSPARMIWYKGDNKWIDATGTEV